MSITLLVYGSLGVRCLGYIFCVNTTFSIHIFNISKMFLGLDFIYKVFKFSLFLCDSFWNSWIFGFQFFVLLVLGFRVWAFLFWGFLFLYFLFGLGLCSWFWLWLDLFWNSAYMCLGFSIVGEYWLLGLLVFGFWFLVCLFSLIWFFCFLIECVFMG